MTDEQHASELVRAADLACRRFEDNGIDEQERDNLEYITPLGVRYQHLALAWNTWRGLRHEIMEARKERCF